MSANKRARPSQSEADSDASGILNERVLVLVFECMEWDIPTLCSVASVNRQLRAVAKRLLWRGLCARRAPRMAAALAPSANRMGGGWHTLAKLMFFCCGRDSSSPSTHFRLGRSLPGHFIGATRFSKTSGRSFLPKGCRSDVLFVSDPCEHQMTRKGNGNGSRNGTESPDDLGIYRGVFEGFMRSRTRACLIRRQAVLEERVRCPYCGSRVWSMTAARLVPKSAARRLGSRDGCLEHFVCVNGHLHGACGLVRLSSDEDNEEEQDDDDDYWDDDDDDRTVENGPRDHNDH